MYNDKGGFDVIKKSHKTNPYQVFRAWQNKKIRMAQSKKKNKLRDLYMKIHLFVRENINLINQIIAAVSNMQLIYKQIILI